MLKIFITIIAISLSGAVSGAPVYSSTDAIDVYPVSTCPYNNSLLDQYTNSLPKGTSSQAAWASVESQFTACPARLTPSAQRVTVNSFSRAQHNLDEWYPEVPRSNVYNLAVLRSTSVLSAYIDIDIVDAVGSVVVPRLQLTLGESNSSVPPVQPLLGTRRNVNRGKRASPKGKHQRHARKAHMGRRKGKGGFMGGIGGNGRYGGGSGGFRGAGSAKSYGYTSKALSNRYSSGYTRTSYGYTGRSRVMPMLLFFGPHHALSGRLRCDQYTGNSRLHCQKSYSNNSFGDGVSSYVPTTPVNRDDIMAATVNSTAKFPLTVRVHRAALVFNAASQPEPWEQPLMFAFSEVDWDDDEDVVLSFIVLCILVGVFFVVVTACCIFCCNCLEWQCWARCCPCCPSCCCRKCRRDMESEVSDIKSDEVVDLQELGPPVAEYKTEPSTPQAAVVGQGSGPSVAAP